MFWKVFACAIGSRALSYSKTGSTLLSVFRHNIPRMGAYIISIDFRNFQKSSINEMLQLDPCVGVLVPGGHDCSVPASKIKAANRVAPLCSEDLNLLPGSSV